MSLAALYNISSDEDLTTLSFANADHHLNVLRFLNQRGAGLTLYILDPIPRFDLRNWARRHQQAHNDINGILGVVGSDLTDVDFSKPEELEAWAGLHWDEHNQWFIQTGVA